VQSFCGCKKSASSNSFDGDTMVWIKENLIGEPSRKKISDLAVGDAVAAWNPATNGYDYKAVTGKSSRLADQTYKLMVRAADGTVETIRTTFNHPFLRADSGAGDARVLLEPSGDWTAAGKLRSGDRIRSATGEPLTVVSAEVDLSPARVYSLEVADLHSFAVGDQGAWGHNAVVLSLNGISIFIFPNDHPPWHVHVVGGGPPTRVGYNCKPISNDPTPTKLQQQVLDDNKSLIKKVIRDMNKQFRDR
jgi:hypothetical protein